MPGVLAIEGPCCPQPGFEFDVSHESRAALRKEVAAAMQRFCDSFSHSQSIKPFRWVVVVDDSQFVAESLRNFLWATFTRTDPASDIYGIDSFTHEKHWGCHGPMVLDARIKPHHAPVLEEDPEITKRVDALGAPGGPLHGIL